MPKRPKRAKITLPKGTEIPDHIVLIPDGNRRWARAKGIPSFEGHRAGAETLAILLRATRDIGVHTTTFWGLSTENWRQRGDKEVNLLIKIIAAGIDKHLTEAKEEGVRVIHLGRKDRLPALLLRKIEKAEGETKKNNKHVFNIALDYNGRNEIVRAVQKIVEDGIKKEKIDEKLIDSYMDTWDQPYPYPDLIIRTSGEQRTSGILAWQSQYAETYWEEDNFPDFTPQKLMDAIVDYSCRRRRFGGNDKEEHFKFKPEVTARLELAWWRLENIPEGTRFRDYSIQHIKEQYGLSKKLAVQAAKYMVEAVIEGKENKWEKSMRASKKFYKLIRDEIKLAFEPALAASLQVKFWKGINGKEKVEVAQDVEETARKLYAEVYRISVFQATKLAHLRVLANIEKNMAERGYGDYHWDRAEDYLEKFYRALKERVA